MDAGRISGSVINTAIGMDYTAKTAEARPEPDTFPAHQWSASCMLQISDAGYRKYEQTHRNTAYAKQTAAVTSSAVKKADPLEDAMANLTRFTEEREQVLNNPTLRTSDEIEKERADALEQVRRMQEDGQQADTALTNPTEGKAGVNRKLRQLSREVMLQAIGSNAVSGGAIGAIYNEAQKNLILAKQEDHVLGNGLSALYRYVIQDTSLSSKDRADAINRFVAEGKQALSKIENSLGYSLARMRSIEDIRQAQEGYAGAGSKTDEELSAQLRDFMHEEPAQAEAQSRPQGIQKKEWRFAV